MAMKPFQAERSESGQTAFQKALAHQDDNDNYVEPDQVEDDDDEQTDPDNIEVYVSDEPEVEETEEKVDPMERLADLLERRDAPKPVKREVPKRAELGTADMAALKKKFDEKLHEVDKPSDLLDEYAEALVGSRLAYSNLEIQKLKRETLKNDPDKSFILEEFGDDVETVIANLPANQQTHPDAYDYAVKQVMVERISDLRAHWLQEEKGPKPTTTRLGKTKTVGGGGQGTTGKASKPKKQVVRATKADEANARRYGMPVKQWLIKIGKIK